MGQRFVSHSVSKENKTLDKKVVKGVNERQVTRFCGFGPLMTVFTHDGTMNARHLEQMQKRIS